MRWDDLFDDLESQLERELTSEEVDLRAEEERLRVARLGIRDRLVSLTSRSGAEDVRMVRLVLVDGTRVTVLPVAFGRDWMSGDLVEESGRRPGCIVPIDAIDSVLLDHAEIAPSLEAAQTSENPDSLSARLGLAFLLRDLCRRRAAVDIQVAVGRLHGTIDRVGRDHFDLAIHEAGRPRRESEVTEYRLVRISRLLLLRT